MAAPDYYPNIRYDTVVWILTTADPVGDPVECGHRNDISVDVIQAAGSGWTCEIRGANRPFASRRTGDGKVLAGGPMNPLTEGKLLNSIPDTDNLSFTADAVRPRHVLPNVVQIAPVLTVPGTAAEVRVEMCMTSAHTRG